MFDDIFPEDNVEDCPKMLSSNTSASDCPPQNVSKPKRKMSAVEQKIDIKCGKVVSATASVAKAVSSKRI
jgi:topoisomerase (DNA) II binding protein 1